MSTQTIRNLPTLQDRPRMDLAKGPSRATLKGRKDRAEAKQEKRVRALCADRDGYCRLHWVPLKNGRLCSGPSEWAHLGAKKRARTRGMAPEKRHTTEGSLMLCQAHHRAYDAGEFDIVPATDRGADGCLGTRLRKIKGCAAHDGRIG